MNIDLNDDTIKEFSKHVSKASAEATITFIKYAFCLGCALGMSISLLIYVLIGK